MVCNQGKVALQYFLVFKEHTAHKGSLTLSSDSIFATSHCTAALTDAVTDGQDQISAPKY